MDDPDDLYTGFRRLNLLGDKVRLRVVEEEDVDSIYPLVTSQAVLATLAWDGPADKAELRRSYRRWNREARSGQSHYLSIEKADRPGAIGCIGLRYPHHPLQADLGYWLGEPYWNSGYTSEAVRLLCHLSFQYLNAERLHAIVFVGNSGSRRVLEKNGFSLDGRLRKHFLKGEKWLDGWFFSLLREEWQDNRERYLPGSEDVLVREIPAL